jgi:hypothetical protein
MTHSLVQPPVIIIGMHRSGTSMLSRVLEELRLFVGKAKGAATENNEAHLFRRCNRWLLRLSGGTWDHPQPIQYLLNNPHVRSLAVHHIRALLYTPLVISYLGWRKYFRYRTPANLDIPWGWKDPRNTYTLPVWLDLFPEAKVIHIYRNGVDVARSLRERSKKDISAYSRRIEKRRKTLSVGRGSFPVVDNISLPCLSLSGGFSLWEAYTQRADEHLVALPESRAMAIRYEDFLADPVPFVDALCQFCGIEPSVELVKTVSLKVDASRSGVYQRSPELFEFFGSVRNSPQMTRYSYQ